MNPKNSKKSPIHENADANITCDFGDGDISRSRSFLSNTCDTYIHTYIASSIIVRYHIFWIAYIFILNCNSSVIHNKSSFFGEKIIDLLWITFLLSIFELLQHAIVFLLQVVKLREVFPHGTGFVLVFEYMLSDLSEVIRIAERPLTEAQVKSYMLMLLKGVAFCHENNIMHRVRLSFCIGLVLRCLLWFKLWRQ